MQPIQLTVPELKIPSPVALERLRVYSLAQYKEKLRQEKIAAAKKAIGLLNSKHLKKWPRLSEFRSRTFSNLNKLRAV